MDIPEDLRYSREHEWVRMSGSVARVGITDFAQDSLGDVVFVQLPDVGLDAVAGASVSEIESTRENVGSPCWCSRSVARTIVVEESISVPGSVNRR